MVTTINVVQAIWGGRVFNPSVNDPSTVAIRALNDKIHGDERVDVSLLVVGDGTMLAFKR